MIKSDVIQARIDPILKEQLKQNRGLPFEADIPNAVTQQTFDDADAGRNLVRAQDADDLFKRLGM